MASELDRINGPDEDQDKETWSQHENPSSGLFVTGKALVIPPDFGRAYWRNAGRTYTAPIELDGLIGFHHRNLAEQSSVEHLLSDPDVDASELMLLPGFGQPIVVASATGGVYWLTRGAMMYAALTTRHQVEWDQPQDINNALVDPPVRAVNQRVSLTLRAHHQAWLRHSTAH